MEEDTPSRHSVSELARRFKNSAPPHDPAGPGAEKPVRRRPPHSLQLPKTAEDDQEQPSGVTSPLPTKAKRNSALIEKLQANLALSPTALLPSPKSPGFKLLSPGFSLLSPGFPPPSPGSTPVTTVTTSTAYPTSPVAASPLTEEEGPASFEDPPTVAEGSILSNVNKGRPRHSIRRRPPSRRHRKSSSGDEVGVTSEGNSLGEPEDKTAGSEEVDQQEGETDEAKEDKTGTSTCPENNESHEEDQSKIDMKHKEEDEKKKEEDNGSTGEEEGDGPSSGKNEEVQEKKPGEKHEEDLTEEATKTDGQEDETESYNRKTDSVHLDE